MYEELKDWCLSEILKKLFMHLHTFSRICNGVFFFSLKSQTDAADSDSL